jgi:hypothetical protein
MGNNEIGDDKNEGELLAILIAVAMQRCTTRGLSPNRYVQGFTGSH